MSVSFLHLGISYFSILRVLRARSCYYLALRRKGERELDVGAKRVYVIYLRYMKSVTERKVIARKRAKSFSEVTENYL